MNEEVKLLPGMSESIILRYETAFVQQKSIHDCQSRWHQSKVGQGYGSH
jgi:hypothetical protein